jgi:hypothetical protein
VSHEGDSEFNTSIEAPESVWPELRQDDVGPPVNKERSPVSIHPCGPIDVGSNQGPKQTTNPSRHRPGSQGASRTQTVHPTSEPSRSQTRLIDQPGDHIRPERLDLPYDECLACRGERRDDNGGSQRARNLGGGHG